nr:MAG TPA: hypothetical protein [Caudoviricetes sp.]
MPARVSSVYASKRIVKIPVVGTLIKKYCPYASVATLG